MTKFTIYIIPYKYLISSYSNTKISCLFRTIPDLMAGLHTQFHLVRASFTVLEKLFQIVIAGHLGRNMSRRKMYLTKGAN